MRLSISNSPYALSLEGGLPALSRRHTCDRRILQVILQGHISSPNGETLREHKLRKVSKYVYMFMFIMNTG